jgi:hypothetical protein
MGLMSPQIFVEAEDQGRTASAALPTPLATQLLAEEQEFYESYPWCLDLFPTVRTAAAYLGRELDRLHEVPADWRLTEVATNIYLLSCALLNAVDDYLHGINWNLAAAAGRHSFGPDGPGRRAEVRHGQAKTLRTRGARLEAKMADGFR